ncbi:MAG: carbonic anhydrase [Oleiphilaceae bacterium]|nr:carbonic anhydrase [Oleiphilaceae bacterium]
MPKVAEGIVRFNKEVYEKKKELFDQLAKGQSPEALFITCSDSRIDPNLLVQTDPGQLFIIRNAGNIVPPHNNFTGGVTASIEYAVAVLKVRHVIICGHSSCGAMLGVLHPESVEQLPHVSQWLSYARAAKQIVCERLGSDASDEEKLQSLIEENVLLQLTHIKTHPHVAAKHAVGELQLHGWTYDIGRGEVRAYDEQSNRFVPVDEKYQEEAQAYLAQQHTDCSH